MLAVAERELADGTRQEEDAISTGLSAITAHSLTPHRRDSTHCAMYILQQKTAIARRDMGGTNGGVRGAGITRREAKIQKASPTQDSRLHNE